MSQQKVARNANAASTMRLRTRAEGPQKDTSLCRDLVTGVAAGTSGPSKHLKVSLQSEPLAVGVQSDRAK